MPGSTIQFTLKADTAQGVAALEKMRVAMQDLGAVSDKTAKTGESSFGGLMSTFTKLGAILGGGMITRNVYEIGKSCVKMAVDAVESENLFEVSMGKMADAARAWSMEVSKALGLNQYELRKNVGTFNVMLSSMGLGTKQAYDMSKSLVVLANDMASFYNIDPEEAFDRLRGGITGMAESLKRMGIVVDEEMVKQYAYKSHIAETGKELTNTQKILARYGTIMEQTSKAQGDMARTIDSPANAMRVLSTRTDELKTTLGKEFLPVLSDVVKWLNEFVKGIDVADVVRKFKDALLPATAALAAFAAVFATIKIAAFIEGLDGIIARIGTSVTKLGAFGQAAAAAGVALLGWEFGRWIANMTNADEWLGKLWDKLGLFKGTVREMEQLAKNAAYKEADALEKRARSLGIGKEEAGYGIDLLHRDSWEDPQKYIDRIKPMLDAYDKLHKVMNRKTEAAKAGAAATHELTEEEKKLQEAWLKQIKPMSSITEEYAKFAKVGATVDQFAQAHWEEIVKATEAQKDFGEPLTKLDQELYNSAMVWKKADDAMKAWHDSLKDIKPEELADIGSMIQKEMNKTQEEIGKIKPEDPLNGIFKMPTEAQLEKDWKEFNRIMGIGAEETKTKVGDEISTIFDDWSKGMADAIIDWKGFWNTMGQIAKDSAKGMLRILFDSILSPVKDQMKKLGNTISEWISVIFKSKSGAGSSGGSVGTSAYGADFIGPTLEMLQGGGAAGKGMFGLPKGGINNKGIGGPVGGILTAGGMMLAMDGMNRSGVGGWVESIGGGAMAGLAQGGPLGMAIGAAAGALTKGVGALIKAIQGKSAYEKGADELTRDFGGLKTSDQEIKDWMGQNNLAESFDRKTMESSPAFLVNFALPLAKAQGKMDSFLKSLEAVKTAWGTFNFRDAFEVGQVTGDWTKLNEEFQKAFATSGALKDMPNWADVFLAPSKAIDDLKNLQTAVKGLVPATKSIYDEFVSTGDIADELATRIKELGGNLEKFKEMSDLTKEDKTWTDLVEHFKETGEILPDLVSLYEKWGGDMERLNAAAALPGLHKSLDFITELKTKLQELAPEQSAVEKILAGNFDQSVIDALTAAGLDPEKFKALAPVISGMSNWDKLASDFQSNGRLTDTMRQALLQYGGSAGQTAVSRYDQGFNTISGQLLADTKAAMDQAYQNQVKGLLGDLTDAENKTTSEITRLTDAVTSEFDKVGNKIADAIAAAASSVVAEIDVMLQTLKTGSSVTQTTGGNGGTVPGGVGGDTVPGDTGDNGGKGDMPPITININGDVYGNADFDARVAQAVTSAWRNGGFAYMRAT